MGEFQKRIIETAKQDGSESNPSGTDWHDTIHIDDVYKIVKSAKKEFPLDLPANMAIVEWFEKWFGNDGKGE